jgi:hypothetical protein
MVKVTGKVIPLHTIKTFGMLEVQFKPYLNLILNGGARPGSLLFPVLGLELQLLGHPACSLDTTLTVVFWPY